jgi:hypothetical protein
LQKTCSERRIVVALHAEKSSGQPDVLPAGFVPAVQPAAAAVVRSSARGRRPQRPRQDKVVDRLNFQIGRRE